MGRNSCDNEPWRQSKTSVDDLQQLTRQGLFRLNILVLVCGSLTTTWSSCDRMADILHLTTPPCIFIARNSQRVGVRECNSSTFQPFCRSWPRSASVQPSKTLRSVGGTLVLGRDTSRQANKPTNTIALLLLLYYYCWCVREARPSRSSDSLSI